MRSLFLLLGAFLLFGCIVSTNTKPDVPSVLNDSGNGHAAPTNNTGLGSVSICVDSDAGFEIFSEGSLQMPGGGFFIDNCTDAVYLQEGVCNSNIDVRKNIVRYRCLYGCLNGACVNASSFPSTSQKQTTPHGMESYDTEITNLMEKWNIPGASVAVAKDGKLVFARGYGYADVETQSKVNSGSRFRIASISKSVTSVAILKLVDGGKVGLDDKVTRFFNYPDIGATDPRIRDITIRELLQHSGGWGSDSVFDPMFNPAYIANEMGVAPPPDCGTIIHYMFTKERLASDPGTKFEYSNFGYCILGRVIENVTGESYEAYVRREVLAPMGIEDMQIASTIEKAPGEVTYYVYPGALQVRSVFDGSDVSEPYGGYFAEATDSHGGWIATPTDIVRFMCELDGSRGSLLSSRSLDSMLERPDIWPGDEYHYGMGLNLRPWGDGLNWWHFGSLPGTTTLVVRSSNGLTWAVFFNSRPKDFNSFNLEVDQALWRAADGVTEWPEEDLFE